MYNTSPVPRGNLDVASHKVHRIVSGGLLETLWNETFTAGTQCNKLMFHKVSATRIIEIYQRNSRLLLISLKNIDLTLVEHLKTPSKQDKTLKIPIF